MQPCSSIHCTTCRLVHPTTSIPVPNSKVLIPLLCQLTCDSEGVIYFIKCSSCGKGYVGETSQKIRRRISQHMSDINNACETSHLLHKHFAFVCAPRHFTFHALAFHPNMQVRKEKEAKWIALLNTRTPHGLNSIGARHKQKTNLLLPFTRCSTAVAAAIRSWLPSDTFRVAFTRTPNLGEKASTTLRSEINSPSVP